MQTFLPYPSFPKSAQVLDNKRLGKQRVEVLQILRAISDPSYGWQNHPAVRMWRGYSPCLALYGVVVCDEWIRRGFKDTCKEKIQSFIPNIPFVILKPPWLGNEKFHALHRSALLYKDPEWYSQFGWIEEQKIDYYWPVEGIII